MKADEILMNILLWSIVAGLAYADATFAGWI
jgi:hypothetical protein